MALTAALIGGASTLGAAGIGALTRSGANPKGDVSAYQLEQQRELLTQQLQQQALVNQRAVAGTSDSFGTTVKYDPITNQWITSEGALPKASDTAAYQAGITRNTTDLQRQELANQEAMKRAALGQPTADAAIRDLQSYRPMTSDDLRGLLTQQATDAARATYDPLRADTLRSVARTGSAAGPVLAQLGKSEASNLRDSLRSALIDSMTNVDQINQSRRAGLENAAANASTLATPQLGSTSIQPSANAALLTQLQSQRAGNAAYTTPRGNVGGGDLNSAYTNAINTQSDPNFGLNQAVSGLKDLGSAFSANGTGTNLLKQLFGGSGNQVNGPQIDPANG